MLSKEEMTELYNLSNLEGFDLLSTETRLKELKDVCKEKQAFCQSREKSINSDLESILMDGAKMDLVKNPNRSIKVRLYSDSMSVKYIFDVKKHNGIDIDINFANSYHVREMLHDKKIKSTAEAAGIRENDVYRIRIQGMEIDLLKHGLSEMDEFIEYTSLCKMMAEQYKYKGLFFSKLKEFYDELNVIWEEISDLHTKISYLSDARKKFLIEEYKKEFSTLKCISAGNVVVVKNKTTDFNTITAYKLDSVKTLYYSGERITTDIKWNTPSSCSEERYYLRIDSDNIKKNEIKNLLSMLAEAKFAGNEILVYTMDEWNMYAKLIEIEKDNILNDLQSDHYYAKSEIYKEIYHRKK